MEQVNYKGHARSIGFDPIKAPYQALEQMAAHDNRVIRGMEENRRAIKEVRNEYQAGLERKFAKERQSRAENHQWKQKLRDHRQDAVKRNADIEIKSALQRGNNAKDVFEGLSQFSTTIADTLTEWKEAKDEQDMLDGYMEVAAGNFSPERQQNMENAETLLKAGGAAQDNIAAGLQARGADPYVVSNLLSGNKARDYGRLKAHMEMSMAEWPDYARAQLDEMGASTAADRTQAMQGLFGQFLKEKGLFGLKSDFMAKGLMQMRGDYNTLISEARRSDIISKSDMMREDALENLFRTKSGDALTEALNTLSRSYGADGKTPMGRAGAKTALLTELSDTTRYSDEDVTNILNSAMTDQGTSWAERFGRDIDDLRTKRRQDKGTEFRLNQAEEQQRQKEAENELLTWVQQSWNGDDETLKEIIKESETKGIPTERLKAYLAYSNEQKNADFWDQDFEERYDQGLLTLEDVDQPGVPRTTRQKWRELAEKQEKSRADAGIKQTDLEKTFKDALQTNLTGDSTDKRPHYSLTPAANQALSRFNQKFKSYSKTMDPVAAAQKAQQEVLMEIEAGKSKNGKQGTGAFAVVPSEVTSGRQAFFAGFTPGNHAGAPSVESSISLQGSLRQFTSNPNILDEKVMVSPSLLKDIDNRIKAGKPIAMPGLFSDLARVTNGTMTATDILNRQLRAAGLQGQVQPGFRNQLSQINDPRLQAILRQPLTQDRLNTAIIGGGHAPATIRTGASGFQDVMAVSSAAGFKFPMIAAAQWALESGYGSAHSGKNNVFGIKGAGNTVSTQEFVNGKMISTSASFRNYNSPLESAQDYVGLMGNSRYAPGIAAARTPREAIQAIAAAGYATDPAYVSKVVKIMTDNGVAVDMPYMPAVSPTRQPMYMRPTLAYITGDIGPTSTGEHLDVKQTNGQRFAENALDSFVELRDPEFGTISLGDLKQRLPGRGDNFDQHVARGSHGIDYPTAKGSQLYLKNGARVISKQRTAHGDKVVVQLPDGRRFSFLHGTSV
jgi:hypothetical protein